jgi:hypothetical protein
VPYKAIIFAAGIIFAAWGCNAGRTGGVDVRVEQYRLEMEPGSPPVGQDMTSAGATLELIINVMITNMLSRSVRFDQVQVSFFANDALSCSSTYALAESGTIEQRFSSSPGSAEPPVIEHPNRQFEIPPGGALPLTVQSKNANFGLFSDHKIRRTAVVKLIQDGAIAFGPFKFDVPQNAELPRG